MLGREWSRPPVTQPRLSLSLAIFNPDRCCLLPLLGQLLVYSVVPAQAPRISLIMAPAPWMNEAELKFAHTFWSQTKYDEAKAAGTLTRMRQNWQE